MRGRHRLSSAVIMLCVLACLFARGAHAQVTVDAQTASAVTTTSLTTITTTSITVGSGSNRALVVGFWTDNLSTNPPGLGCVWDSGGSNQTMTAITGTDTGTSGGVGGGSVLFGLVNPISGAKTLACSWTSASRTVAIFAISFTGVDQTGGATTFPHGTFVSQNTPVAGPITLNITSATNNKVVSMFGQNCVPFGALSGTVITAELDMSNLGVISSYNSGAATVAQTAAYTGTCVQIASGTDILASGGGGGATSSSSLSLMGIGP